jgi:hypothetical protein
VGRGPVMRLFGKKALQSPSGASHTRMELTTKVEVVEMVAAEKSRLVERSSSARLLSMPLTCCEAGPVGGA